MKVEMSYGSTPQAIVTLKEGFRLLGSCEPDTDLEPPWEDWDGEGKVEVFNRVGQAADYIAANFSKPDAALEALLEARMVKDTAGQPCFALEAYIHGGEVWGLPNTFQVDRRWDVTQMRALWIADEDVLDNLGKGLTEEALRKYLKSCLTTWNQYLAGDVWYCQASLQKLGDDGRWRTIEELESLGWIYGEDGVKDFMEEQALVAQKLVVGRQWRSSQ